MIINRLLRHWLVVAISLFILNTQTVLSKSACCGSTPAVAWHPHGAFVATAHGTKGIRIYQINFDNLKATLAKTIENDTDDTCSIAWSPCGRFLIAGNFGTPNKIYFFSPKGCSVGDPMLLEYGEHDSTTSLAWCRSGKFLAVGNDGQPNKIYEFTGNCADPFGAPILISSSSFRTTAIAWSCDCMQIAVGNCDGSSIVYNFMPGATTPLTFSSFFGCGGDCVKSLSWSVTCCLLAVGNKRGPSQIFKSQLCCNGLTCTTKLVPAVNLDTGDNTHVTVWDPIGQILFEGNWGSPSKLFRLASNCCDPSKITTCTFADLNAVTAASWSPCGNFLAIGSNDKPTVIYKVVLTATECELENPITLPPTTPSKPLPGGKIFDCFCTLLTNPNLTAIQFKNLLSMLINIEMKQGSNLLNILESLLCDCLGQDTTLTEDQKQSLVEGLIAVLNDLKNTGSVTPEKQKKFQSLVQTTVKPKKKSARMHKS